MKKTILIILLLCCFSLDSYGQDKEKIERAALDYIEGFYEGDTTKIKRSIHPDLSKLGYGSSSGGSKEHIMTYERAIGFARDVAGNPEWAAPKDAVKKIEILDAQDKIACVKLTLYWGIDYLLMVKYDDKWMISKVLWQSLE
ncbi:nuclear transport factor 2 family protein [Aureisphaera galaxeae]|uniref:nuclear transport factor 2 family protein n=1 Tax=Aureisphaera galaxeae TaxID=1538023 RepID=UPI00235095E4|nr:nuclear transport factor 2 family protein [Aureisphaera galaxeae]MDC8003901.1 nuclear transport factor 2 family protein [Aureisphaera galaxeae]